MSAVYKYFCNFFATPRNVLALAAGIGLAGFLILLLADPVFYRDSVYYSAMIQAFAQGNWTQAFLLRLPPLVTLLGGPLCLLGVDPVRSALAVSSLFLILTVFPLYGWLCFFVERKYAAWGALFFILTPKILRYGLAPLLDSGRWFFFALSLYLISRIVRYSRRMELLYLGGAFAGLALIRAEGVVYVALLSATLLLLLLHRADWKPAFRQFGRMLFFVLLPLLVMLLLLSPRLIHCYRETGFPAVDQRQSAALASIAGRLAGSEKEAESNSAAIAAGKLQLSRYRDPDFNRRFWKNYLLGGYEPYLALALLGLVLLLYRNGFVFRHGVMLGWFLLNGLAFLLMQSAAGRYFYINVIILLPFTLHGYRFLLEFIQRRRSPAPQLFAAGLLAIGVLQLDNGLDNARPNRKQAYFKHVGRLIAEQSGTPYRSGTARPVLLTVGDNYGWGYYADANMIIYRDVFTGLEDQYDLEAVVAGGVPARYAVYTAEKLTADRTVFPDYVLVTEPEEHEAEIAWLRTLPGAAELPTGSEKQVCVFYFPAEKP